jgi:hypothetical protein
VEGRINTNITALQSRYIEDDSWRAIVEAIGTKMRDNNGCIKPRIIFGAPFARTLEPVSAKLA